ncbi:PilZ domain-containing protein [Desulfosoma caldarium]|uniref:PilZ domain-containing protein n=1 Tax=Desulfosoma caldarium TaxID=610254 RepID=A0A3N1ULV9_9BACT|nr:PilZ domain-containing protein [Desulfosoma caldarium]ROQ90708.1 PilZ domain-containing protein [Desulfosoma caldarium]
MQMKVFATQDGKATIVCPQCGLTRRVDASSIYKHNKNVTVRCSCGHSFRVSFEIRQAYRKSTFLFGQYRKIMDDSTGPFRQMTVLDISQHGCRFKTPIAHNLQVNDLVHLEIPLTDARKSIIKVTAQVRYVESQTVGVAFVDFDGGSEKALSFFLLP